MTLSVLRILCFTLVVAISLSPAVASQVFAQSEEVSQLRQRVIELEQRTKGLEDQLKECSEARKKQEEADYGWQNKKNWRSLEVGMKEDQVRSILGEPVKVINGVKTLWYYPNFYGGYVSFSENGKLTGWNEP
jgi:vacuolar-type H+-ATPase subunit I/STV1